ncbi:hypothetical protein SAMN05880556_11526 [Azospirillum sp. RU38E]|nr:hypothetical protein SAMN05880556_11526 [Azospirillum sp. RU38E]SNT08160.1 hypothetical protein SAMN05880591_11526 [Azospirillum sp. RU37A]
MGQGRCCQGRGALGIEGAVGDDADLTANPCGSYWAIRVFTDSMRETRELGNCSNRAPRAAHSLLARGPRPGSSGYVFRFRCPDGDTLIGVAVLSDQARLRLKYRRCGGPSMFLMCRPWCWGRRPPPTLSRRLAERAAFDHAALDAAAQRGRAMPLPQILPAEVFSRAAAVGAATLPLASTFFSLLPVAG